MRHELLRIDNLNIITEDEITLRNINLNLFENELLCLFGVHKSGKTALAQTISGFNLYTDGTIYIDDDIPLSNSFEQVQKQGVFYLTNSSMLIPNLSVEENIFAIRKHSAKNLVYNHKKAIKRAEFFLNSYSVNLDLGALVEDLDGFQILLVQIFKAFLMGAKIIILDDYSSDIYAVHYPILLNLMKDLNTVSFIYISNSIDEIVKSSDRIAVMSRGKIVKYIHHSEYSSRLLMQCAYGHYWNDSFNRELSLIGDEVLSIDNITVRDKSLSLSLLQGEIIGIYDLDGCGQQIINQLTHDSLTGIRVCQVYTDTFSEAVKQGLAVVSAQYLESDHLACFTPINNITFQILRSLSSTGIIKRRMEKYFFHNYSINLNTAATNVSNHWFILKMILYRKLLAKPQALVVDNISSGFAYTVRQELFQILDNASKSGTGILFIFSDLIECFHFCNYILIPSEQKKNYLSIDPKESSIEEIIALINRT